jgi:hypothetical protein
MDSERPPNFIGHRLIESSAEARSILECKYFWEKCLNYYSEAENVGKLISYISWRNPDANLLFSELFLHGLNHSDSEEAQPYFLALSEYLQVKDQYQVDKLESIFGLASYIDGQVPSPSPMEMPKLGMHCIEYLYEQVFEYFSPLTWLNVQMETVLSLIFKHSGKSAHFTLQWITQIISLMINDRVILKFMADTPAPTYEFSRYIDWFGFYIDSIKGIKIKEEEKMRAKELF